MRHDSQLGAKLGPRVARVVVDAQADHLRKTAHTRAKIDAAGQHIFWRDIARERDAHLKPLLDLLQGHEDTHPAVEQALRFMGSHQGELAGMLTSRTVGGAISASILGGVVDLVAPVNQRIMQTAPNLTIGVGDAVSAAVAGVWSDDKAGNEAARQGINAERFHVLRALGTTFPDLVTAIELWRRGLADEGEVIAWLRHAGYTDAGARLLTRLKHAILQPADLALMDLRGIIDRATGHAIAAESGVSAEDFDRLVLATGEPPGPESLMMALRRGFIDDARFAHGIRQSRIRNEWIGLMEQLRFSPMATADAVNAVVRNYMPAHEGQRIAEQNGLEPAHWRFVLESHGRPPGHMEMVQLQRRGLVSQAQVDQAVRESDVKDKYVGTLRGLKHHLPAERLIVNMIQHGALDEKRGLHLLEEVGFAPDIARAIVRTGASQRTAGHKQVALSTVLQLFEDHAIDHARAETMIVSLGYPKADVPILLRTTELKREARWREQGVGAVRAGYLAHHIDENEARADLGAIGIPAAQVAWLLRLWAIERRAHRRTLTEAQIMHAHRGRHIDGGETVNRLVGIGYSAADAEFLVTTSGPLPRGA